MTRALLLAALILATATAAQAPRPLAVQASAGPAGTAVAWRAPLGQRLACVFRVEPPPTQPIDCARGGSVALTIPAGGDAALQVSLGDLVEVRSYGEDGVELARGRARVLWRLWFAQVGAAE